jgi:hypothetical protein
MSGAPKLPVDAALLAAMEASLGAVADMTTLSRRVFDRFLNRYPDEAVRFINVDAAVLRMTDETFVLLHGLASGEGWAAPSAAHWIDLHRNYGAIAGECYTAWTALCLSELATASAALWPGAAPGWRAAADSLDALLLAENGLGQGTSQRAAH